MYGELPVKMCPSAGERNPYECFLVARKIKNLDEGTYHYSATEHNLQCVNSKLSRLSKIVGDQDSTNNAACIIILVANVKRDMWKCLQPGAYNKPMIIEAGHIVQNILLTATELNPKCCPSAAINDSYIENLLDLDPIIEAPIYTVSIGKPLPEYEKWYDERPTALGVMK